MTFEHATGSDEYEALFQMETLAAAGGGVIDDPYTLFAARQAEGPVHKGSLAECIGLGPESNGGSYYTPGRTYYSVFTFAAVSDAFTRKNEFNSEAYSDMGIPHEFGDTILNMDGLRHRHYRDIIQEYFQPPAAAGWWHDHVILPLVEELVTGFEHLDSVDLNARFFARLPLGAITLGFGMSTADGLEFRRLMSARLYAVNPEDREESKEAAGRLLMKVIVDRQKEPRDDLISRLSHADLMEEDGSRRKLTLEEIASFCRLIVFAGGETTWRQMGNALFCLLNHPDQLADVIRDRSLLQPAILESTRLHADPMFPRKVTHDTIFHGVELPAGAHLHLCLGAANRDPSRWKDPDDYNIRRPLQRSVSFGAGVHSCLGQHVARQEIAAALNALFDRFPTIRWDPSKPPARIFGNLAQRGPGPLHVLLH